MSAISLENIHKASAQFWEQMLDMHLEPCGKPGLALISSVASNPIICWLIAASAAYGRGRIEVRFTLGLARLATAAMLMQSLESVEAADMIDATKEIANMIAGTLKSALPRPCMMTVPSAEWIDGEFCVLPRTEDTVAVFFHHSAGELMVRVWQQAYSYTDTTEPLAVVCA